MFISRKHHRIEIALARLEMLLQTKSPDVIQSAEVLRGIKKQLAMALPRFSRERRFLKPRNIRHLSNKIEAILEVVDFPANADTFDDLRRAVIAAAKSERDRLDILVETHLWLKRGNSHEDITAQLEDRFKSHGILIINNPTPEQQSFLKYFKYFGEGPMERVIAPAYCALLPGDNEDSLVLIRQGHIERSNPKNSREDNNQYDNKKFEEK